MRRAVHAVAAALLLAGPTVLAFFSGGYFTDPRLVAGIVAWSLVLSLAIVGPAPLPRTAPGRVALAGLVLLTAWSALSLIWAPLGGPAGDSVQRLVLYAGALVVALGVLRATAALSAVEPALAAGAAIVICYGLAGRLLPGIVELAQSQSAGGRLEQPITYWNAEGALAAVGLVLCARVAGDGARPDAMRAIATGAAAPLGAGVYLTYSRGAIAAALVGLVILVALAQERAQLRAAVLVLATATAAAALAAAFPGVAALEGTASDRRRDGALVLMALVVLATAAAMVCARGAMSERRAAPAAAPPWMRRLGPIAAFAVAGVAVGLAIGGLAERPNEREPATGATPSRLASVSSNRYEYWRVGFEAFRQHPAIGLGAGGFRVFWLQKRSITEGVRDAHSLEIEIAAELGLVGLVGLALLVGGIGTAARSALRRRRALAAGPCAALLAWLLHASIDWDWQLPAVTLPAIVLAGALVVLAEPAPQALVGSAAEEPAATAPALSGTAGR